MTMPAPSRPVPPPRLGFARWLRRHRNELLGYLTVALIVAMLGIGLALMWWALAPKLAVVIDPRGALIKEEQPEQFVASDAHFALIAGVAGIVLGLAVWFLRKWRGPGMVVALAIGSFVSSWVMWKLGAEIGRVDGRDDVSGAAMGQHISVPIVELRSHGLLFLQSLLIVLVYIMCVSWTKTPGLRGDSSDARQPMPPIAPGDADQNRLSSLPTLGGEHTPAAPTDSPSA